MKQIIDEAPWFGIVGALVLAVALTVSTGCTPKATFQQGVFAGQSSERIGEIVNKQDARTEFWQNRAINFERNDAIAKAAEKKALAMAMRDPARAADSAWSVAIEFASQMEALDAVDRNERMARAGDVAYGLELARTPVDVANMSARQDAARQRFARETATMTIATGTQILAQYQEHRTRKEQEREAARQAEELRKEMAARETALAEREAHIEHAPPPPPTGSPVQPIIVAPERTTPNNTGE